ncbi:phosphoribosylaminoimidazolesuccinocarboxamide synthase [Candidatus Micrarchaeota archaeon]|nr:phosphoribosylaminoimidazolesuccinocarboxamide synthase [Candidatus Micrarchaeota archaeon]MBU1166601.1 phosphoribosylaminoimidazolesuccinocarboxamide synthase [Candidatus Micrarchaeota archaeon]MBU1887267.1 phosphoribosylaminoimidazolesuccinocarboxamide synthase [Candidatus Micrarchaeota archaeon]
MEAITQTDLDLELLGKGKVRDTYILNVKELLMVATDRLSAFDVVFSEGIPKKGEVLTKLSAFWFEKTKHIIPNHFISLDVPEGLPQYLKGRSMVVKRAKPIHLECVVRGYLTGSGLKDYQKTGSVCGIKLPEGLKNGSELPEPIFTPSTKAQSGHDENINGDRASNLVGKETFELVKTTSIELYKFAKNHALKCGLVLADTKFEFGYIEHNACSKTNLIRKEIILMDEALTPDSSRYWLKDKYDSGILESLDKQYVRDYLETLNWNKSPPAPKLPEDVIKKTTERYLEAYQKLTGEKLE